MLGDDAIVFPSHHGGFAAEDSGYPGQPEAFARTLREVTLGAHLARLAEAEDRTHRLRNLKSALAGTSSVDSESHAVETDDWERTETTLGSTGRVGSIGRRGL